MFMIIFLIPAMIIIKIGLGEMGVRCGQLDNYESIPYENSSLTTSFFSPTHLHGYEKAN